LSAADRSPGTGGFVPSKATRSQHYLNIAEFYGRTLVEDMKDSRIPEFVLAHSARRAAHFALVGLRLAERRRAPRPVWQDATVALADATLPASLS
jgi:hypothetical protein